MSEHDAIPSKWVTDYHANNPQPDNPPMEFMDEANRIRLRKHAEQHRDEPWFYGSAVLILLDTIAAIEAGTAPVVARPAPQTEGERDHDAE